MRTLSRVAFRNIGRNRLRSGFTLMAIAMAVAGLSISEGFIENIYYQIREGYINSQIGHIQIFRPGFSKYGFQRPNEYFVQPPKNLIMKLEELEGVRFTTQRLVFSGALSTGKSEIPIIGQGVEPEKENEIGNAFIFIEGRDLKPQEEYSIVVGEGLANSLNLKAGASISLLASSAGGAANLIDFKVVGIFRSVSKTFDDRGVRISLKDAQTLMDTESIHSIVLLLVETKNTKKTLNLVEDIVSSNKDIEAQAWFDLAVYYKKSVDLFKRQYGFLQLAILLMVLLLTNNTITTSIQERYQEIATLRAIGDRNFKIFKLLVTEYFILTLAGVFIGIVVAIVITTGINQKGIPMPPPPNYSGSFVATIMLDAKILFKASLLIFIGAMIAVVWPAKRATKMSIASALHEE